MRYNWTFGVEITYLDKGGSTMSTMNKELVTSVERFLQFAFSVAKHFTTDNPMEHAHISADSVHDEESLRRGWDKMAPIWPSVESRDNYFITMYTLLERMRTLKRKEKWLSIGSGPALYEIWLNHVLDINFRVTDFSPEMIRLAKLIRNSIVTPGSSMQKDGSDIRFSTMSMDKITFPRNNFNSVLSINALQWVPGWRTVISEVSRVTKEDGNFYLICGSQPLTAKDDDGMEHVIADISVEGLFDEMEKNRFKIIFSRQMVIKEGQLGGTAKRIFIHGKKTSAKFDSWRTRDRNATLTVLGSK
jgi:ubiquinone/menaquinone biosynthesis C-methylase UbiE